MELMFIKDENKKYSSPPGPMDDDLSDEDTWDIIGAHFNEHGLLHTQLESYNEFVEFTIGDVIAENNRVEVDFKGQHYSVEFGNPIIEKPSHIELSGELKPVTPKQCIDRDMTYYAQLYTDVTYTNALGLERKYENIHIGSIPVMVKSSLCNLVEISDDPQALADLGEDIHANGAEFIINGAEKILTSQQRTAYNKPYVFQTRKVPPKYVLYTEVRSNAVNGAHSTTTQVGFHKEGLIGVIIPYIEMTDIPLAVLFRALGAEDENDMVRYILPDITDKQVINLLIPSLEQGYDCSSQDAALHYIGKRGKKYMGKKEKEDEDDCVDDEEFEIKKREKREKEDEKRENAISYARHLLATEFIPHLGTGAETFVRKMFYLGYMVLKLIETKLGRKELEDRDHCANKRVANALTLLGSVFYNSFKRMRTEIANGIEKCIKGSSAVNIISIIKPGTIKNALTNAILINSWNGRGKNQGISQAYERFNSAAGIANARKLGTSIQEGGKIEKPRRLDNTHWGAVCVTGDTKILLSDGRICRIDNLNGRPVTTVDPVTLKNEPSDIYNFIKLNPAKLLKISDDCGRTIKCTPDHPFLVNQGGKNVWKNAGEMNVGDMVVCTDPQLYKSPDERMLPEEKCLSSIESIVVIDPEEVYDFTTVSPNHSFISNSFVTHNCPSETPEGKKTGLITNEAMTLIITTGSDPREILNLVEDMNIINFDEVAKSRGNLLKLVKIFVNGDPIGVTHYPDNIVNELRILRRSGGLNPEVSVSYNSFNKEISISTESGRMCRPLLVVEKGRVLLKKSHIKEIKDGKWDDSPGSVWNKLLSRGFVELVDKAEEESALIATYPEDLSKMEPRKRLAHTHCELHPCIIFGVGVSLIPYPDHNQAPRNTYQASMGKQAVGVIGTNFNHRTKGKFHIMNYSQRPIVSTKMSKIIGFNDLPAGQNAVIMVVPLYGYNQEDSVMMNQDSIDREFMVITTYTAFDGKVRVDKGEKFEVPTRAECSNFRGNTSKLNPESGIIMQGETVNDGDILIGRTKTVDDSSSIHRQPKQNISVIYDHVWPGKVHLVRYGIDGEGYSYVRVVIAQQRTPQYGDKFAARHGQKGTVGMTYRSCDLPYTKEGISPDIMLNPLAFPSRMTVGMLIETLSGRTVCDTSYLKRVSVKELFRSDDEEAIKERTKPTKKRIRIPNAYGCIEPPQNPLSDATAFSRDFSLFKICQELKNNGINEFCDEEVTNGITGKKMKCLIFTGVCYYQRLKHMVIDKFHSRARGGRTRLTRQPPEGRKNGGGFRTGGMERDCNSAGTPILLSEGICVKIETLVSKNHKLYGWCPEKDGIVVDQQTDFAYKGKRLCYQITLKDGRTIKATDNHPFLTTKKEWIDLKDLVVGEDILKVSVNPPLVDMEKDMEECEGWRLHFENGFMDVNTYPKYLKMLAMARLLGWVVTDSHVSKSGRITLSLGHQLDVDWVKRDLEVLGFNKVVTGMSKNTYVVYLPSSLNKHICSIPGVLSGAKVNQPASLPDFILDEKCPRPIIREFLASYFGADGHSCCLSLHRGKRDLLKSMALSETKTENHVDSLISKMEKIGKLLERCGVKGANIQNPKETSNSKKTNGIKHQEVVLNIPVESLIDFAEKVGIRYCVHKLVRLEAAASYRRFREGCMRQRHQIVDSVTEMRNSVTCGAKPISYNKGIEKAVENLKSTEPILHKLVIPDANCAAKMSCGEYSGVFRSANFPTAEEYLREINALDLFYDDSDDISYGVKRDKNSIPTFDMEIIDIREYGEEDVYDITVRKTHSFVANGIISHNCLLSQGVPYFTKDRLMEQSDETKMYFCKICGLPARKIPRNKIVEEEDRWHRDPRRHYYCNICETKNIAEIKMPYGTKLLMEEYMVMNIVMRVIVSSYGEPGDTAHLFIGDEHVTSGIVTK